MAIEVEVNGATIRLPDDTPQDEIARLAKLVVPPTEEEDQPTRKDLAVILDFIRSKEAPKGYNQIVGKDKSAPLDDMTYDEVMKFQKEKMTRSKGFESTAVGGYQFINGTMKDLKRWLDLTGEEKLTPALQDRMAIELMRKKGLDRWAKGDITDERFATSLSKIWASLPVVEEVSGKTRGASFYAGVGSNQALVTPEDVLGTLKQQSIAGVGFEEGIPKDDEFARAEAIREEEDFEVPTDELAESFVNQESTIEDIEPLIEEIPETSFQDVGVAQPDPEPQAEAPVDVPPQAAAPAPEPGPDPISSVEDLPVPEGNPTLSGQTTIPNPTLNERIRDTINPFV